MCSVMQGFECSLGFFKELLPWLFFFFFLMSQTDSVEILTSSINIVTEKNNSNISKWVIPNKTFYVTVYMYVYYKY